MSDIPEAEIWLNALKIISPTDEFLIGLGRDVLAQVKASMSRERDPLEPIGLVNLRISAS